VLRRDKFLEIALTWVDVPWRKVGTRRDGVNCVGLLVGIARECGFLDNLRTIGEPYAAFERPPLYGDMVRKGKEHLEPVSPRLVIPGDLLMFRIDQDPQHITIVTGPGQILHVVFQDRVRNQSWPAGWHPNLGLRIPELDDDL